jgi:hypothetical protein
MHPMGLPVEKMADPSMQKHARYYPGGGVHASNEALD